MKPADLAVSVNEVHFKDPVADLAGSVSAPHRCSRTWCDVRLDLLAVDCLVREFSDEVAGVRSTEFPARLRG
jgi:hypothetical protein